MMCRITNSTPKALGRLQLLPAEGCQHHALSLPGVDILGHAPIPIVLTKNGVVEKGWFGLF